LHQIQAELDSLKFQHAALSKSVASLVNVDTTYSSTSGTPFQSMIMEEPQTSEPSVYTPNLNKSHHTSALSISSDIWYDAPELDDGPEEFLLDVNQDDRAPKGRIIPSENHSMIEQDSASIADTDSGEETFLSVDQTAKTFLGQAVAASRTQLPSLPPADEGSLFTVLKKNVGKVCEISFRRLASSQTTHIGSFKCCSASYVQ
jgi:oxysterol-binding protein-related protein 3/6/7